MGAKALVLSTEFLCTMSHAGPSFSRDTAVSSPSTNGKRTSPAWNPISLRLYKVLGANYDDSRTRDALETLSAYYASPPITTAWRHVDPGEPIASDQIIQNSKTPEGHAYNSGDIAVRARRNLRRDTEARLAEGSEKFLKAFRGVDDACNPESVFLKFFLTVLIQKLNLLEDFIQEMVVKCDEAEAKLKTTTEVCKDLLDRAEGLRLQR